MKRIIILLNIFITCTSLLAQANLDSGLVAYYPFNRNANDESGNANHGVVNGAVLADDHLGNPNCAFMFDGIDDFIDCGNGNSLNGEWDGVTITAWILPSALNAAQHIAGKWAFDRFSDQYSLYLSDDRMGIAVADSSLSEPASLSNDSLMNGNWYHIVGTWEKSTREYNLFINGILDTTLMQVGNGINSFSTTSLKIGRQVIGQDRAFNGIIDDVRIYNRVLSHQEIQYVYNYVATSISETSNYILQKYTLYQNYPNPFNPTTRLSYSITKPEHVTIKVYDIHGREIRVLFDDYIKAGTHSVNFDANNLSSGIYFCCFRAGTFKQTGKMLLNR